MWIRYVRYKASTDCCYEGNKMLYRGRLIFPERTLIARFREQPTDDIREWAENIIRDRIFQVAENACKELSDDYEACDIDPGIIYTSETFVGPAVPVKEVPVPVKEVPVKAPRDVQLRIEKMQEYIKEAETLEAKMALEEELRNLKERYGIK